MWHVNLHSTLFYLGDMIAGLTNLLVRKANCNSWKVTGINSKFFAVRAFVVSYSWVGLHINTIKINNFWWAYNDGYCSVADETKSSRMILKVSILVIFYRLTTVNIMDGIVLHFLFAIYLLLSFYFLEIVEGYFYFIYYSYRRLSTRCQLQIFILYTIWI